MGRKALPRSYVCDHLHLPVKVTGGRAKEEGGGVGGLRPSHLLCTTVRIAQRVVSCNSGITMDIQVTHGHSHRFLLQGHASRPRWKLGVGSCMYAADTLHLHRRIPWRIGTAAVARPDGCAHRHHREANWPHLTAIGRWGGRWGARRWDYHIRPQSAAQSIPPDAAAHGLPSSNGGVGSIGATLRDGGSSPVGGLARSGLDGTDEPKPPRSSVPETSHSGVAEGSKAPKKSVKFRGVHRHRLTGNQ